MDKNYFDNHIHKSSDLANQEEMKILIAQQGAILSSVKYKQVKPNSILDVAKSAGTGLFNTANEILSSAEKGVNTASQYVAREIAKRTHNLTDDDLPSIKYEDHASTMQRLNPTKTYSIGEQLALNAAGDPLSYVSAGNLLKGYNYYRNVKAPKYFIDTKINFTHPRDVKKAKEGFDKLRKVESIGGVVGLGMDYLDNGVINKHQQGGILYAQQGVSLKSYFNKAVDGAIESLKLPHKAMQMYGDVAGSGYSAPGQIANKAAQTVAREVAKRTHNLTENDLPKAKAKYESHSETFNRLISPKRDMNFIESLGLDLVGDPTTVIAGKKVSSKINKSIKPRQANLFGKNISKIESTPLLHESDVAAGNKQWDDWVRSDEYAKRRSATTGETVEEANKQGVKLTERKWGYKNNTNASDNNVGGYSPKVLIGKDIISIGKGLTKDEAIQVFNHEYGHMRSPAAKSGSDKLYKDYPTIKFEEKDWGSKRMADYQNLPEEQQVRFMRTNFKIREDLGLPTKEMQPLTEVQMNNWFDNFNLKSLRSQQGYDDILEFIETGVVSNKLNRNNLREYLNKAWTGAAVGTGASIGLNEIQKQKQGGVINKIQYAQQGTKIKLNSNDIADIRESEDLKELRRQLKMPIDLKVRNYADNTSTVQTMNRPKSDVETRSLNRDAQAKKIANNDIVLKNKQTVLARKERIAKSSMGGSENGVRGTTALGDRARIFKDDPNSLIDEYVNPLVGIGSVIDNFNDTWLNKNTPSSTVGEKLLSAGMLGATMYGMKAPVNKTLNIADDVANMRVIPVSRKRILPDKFKVTTNVTSKDGYPKYETILHDAKDINKKFGKMTTRERFYEMTPTDPGKPEMFPLMVEVNDAVKGNKVQDMLYQSNLDAIKKDGVYNHIRSGDDLLQPHNTKKLYDRSITTDVPKTGDIYFDPITGEDFFLAKKRYMGSKNPNINKEVMDKLHKLKKHEIRYKSIMDFIKGREAKGKSEYIPKTVTRTTTDSYTDDLGRIVHTL